MAQQKKRIFWIGFARVCAKSLFCQGFTAKRNDAQKTQSMHYGSCSALLLLQKADRQPPLHEKGAAARISGVVRRLRPFCHRCPGASGRTPQKCTTPAKHGAQYPRAVDLPPMHGNFDRITVHFLFAEKPYVSMVSGFLRHNRARPGVISGAGFFCLFSFLQRFPL